MTMAECTADINRCIKQIRTLREKHATANRTLRKGIEADLEYWRGHLDDCIDALAQKLGEQYDWLGRNAGSPHEAEIWASYYELGVPAYQDACDYRDRLPAQLVMV